MRWLLALLVVANAFAFALFQGWLSPWVRGEREPQRLLEQRDPDRLRVVPLERLGTAQPPAPSSPQTRPSPAASAAKPAQTPGAVPVPSPAPSSPPASSGPGLAPAAPAAPDPSIAAASPPATTTASAAGACVAFGPLDEARAGRLREALESAGARVESTRIEQAASYLVYVPPARTPAEAQQHMADLRRIGQTDVFLMQDGPQRLGISVGLFRSEESARVLVARLESLGETGLRIAPRGAITTRVRLQARWPDAAAAEAAAAIGSRFDAPPRDCR